MNLEVGKQYQNASGHTATVLANLNDASGNPRASIIVAKAPSGDYSYEVDNEGRYAENTAYNIVEPQEGKFELGKFYESESGKWCGTPVALGIKVLGYLDDAVNVFALYNVNNRSDKPDIRVFTGTLGNRSAVGSVVLYRGREMPAPNWL